MIHIEERDWLVALHGIDGIGRKSITRIADLLDNRFSEVKSLEFDRFKENHHIKKAKETFDFMTKQVDAKYVSEVKQRIKHVGVTCLTLLDDDYPSLLKEIHDPPWVLYYIGNQEILSNFTMTIVGTRNPTSYGKTITKQLVKSLVSGGATIVSGLARGIDSIAHDATIEAGGTTIAVLGCGIDVIYPPENRELYRKIGDTGLLLSEYPLGTNPHPGLFPERNRIISGLSNGTVVVEANARSGSLITADQAIEQGRDVFAIPGPITSPRSEGPNTLIQQGAKLITNAEDIWEEYPGEKKSDIFTKTTTSIPLTPVEQSCIDLLSNEPLHIEQIIDTLGIPAHKAQAILLSLQLKKQLILLPGQMYSKL